MSKKMSLFETLRVCRFLSALGGLPNLPRYETLAVADYGCTSHALHLLERRDLTTGKLNNRSIWAELFPLIKV
jgi:hypothetical protein